MGHTYDNAVCELWGEVEELTIFGEMLHELSEADTSVNGWSGRHQNKLFEIGVSIERRAQRMREYLTTIDQTGTSREKTPFAA
ncbi:hypothetical protein [Pseudodesulfovibrio sp.]|uniref:hypothetical protein n=1 Tax=Pseudodesulfovibrio sp. TaxID=2035812 RepID=UPI00262AAB3A|nr:hypothetical protein [Pseudodesulfovibrio sp.]MDD3313178.1 hypothetical protein [Pseudodesulfovibrio sp.]